MNPNFPLQNATLLIALASIYPLQVHAAAGVAQFAVGAVNVQRGAGIVPLSKGQSVESGDTISTGPGSQAQVRFSDGGLVALQANTQFAIRSYADQGSGGNADSFIVDFLQGGMRAITGLIGKRSAANYKVNTKTATIGIRGSAFAANYNTDGSLTIGATQDEIVVCTNGGCTSLTVGEIARVAADNSTPTRTNVRTNLPLVEVRQDPQLAGNQSGANAPVAIASGLSASFAVNDGGYSGSSILSSSFDFPFSDGTGTFTGGQLVTYDNESEDVIVAKEGNQPGSFFTLGAPADADFLGWGYWMSGSKTEGYSGTSALTDVHYVVGRPTPSVSMPTTGTASYALVGGTAPTANNGGTLLTGQLVSAGLEVDFGANQVSVEVNTRFSSGGSTIDVPITGSAGISGSTFGCGGSTRISGIFTGVLAARAGLVYLKEGTPVGTVSGAAGFVQSSSTGLAVSLPN